MKILGCEFPDSLLYDVPNSTWVRREKDLVRVGVTSVIAWSSGTFSTVSLGHVGQQTRKGGIIGSVEGSKHFDVVRSPVAGTISEVNHALESTPRLLNSEPYDRGWFAELEPSDLGELDALGRLPGSARRIEDVLRTRGARCFARFPDLELFEIGVECAAVFVQLNQTLAGTEPGTVVHVVSDDPTAEVEMERWANETKNELLESRAEGNIRHFIVTKAS